MQIGKENEKNEHMTSVWSASKLIGKGRNKHYAVQLALLGMPHMAGHLKGGPSDYPKQTILLF